MKRTNRLTEGNILHTLIRFAVPVFFTLFLQALYGGVDLLVVGQFAATADVSGVATGSMLMSTVTMVITGLSMGITILVGERIGRGEPDEAGRAIGGGICLFAVFGVLLMVVLLAGAETPCPPSARAGGGLCRNGGVHPHLRRRQPVHRGLQRAGGGVPGHR